MERFEANPNQPTAEDLLSNLTIRKAEVLVEKHALDKPGENVKSSLAFVSAPSGEISIEDMVSSMNELGYSGAEIVLDKFKSWEELSEFKQKLDEYGTEIISIHGSLDPYFLGLTAEPDPSFIQRDFEAAELLDPEGQAPINYDLVAAYITILRSFQEGSALEDLQKTQQSALEEKGLNDIKQLIEQTVKHVAESRPENLRRRPVLFETRQTPLALSPEITHENISFLVEACRKYFENDDEWGITIDLGHTFASLPHEWGVDAVQETREKMQEIVSIMNDYKDHIKMLHLCGDVTATTVAGKHLAERENLDHEAVKLLGLHQVIDNQMILEATKQFRELKGSQNYIEVSETVPLHYNNRYYGDRLKTDSSESVANYKKQIELQAKMLGYS